MSIEALNFNTRNQIKAHSFPVHDLWNRPFSPLVNNYLRLVLGGGGTNNSETKMK